MRSDPHPACVAFVAWIAGAASAVLAQTGAAGAAGPATAAESITEARALEVVTWLAADERGGRDTPSPGLEAAAEWLAARFAAAGLQQAQKDSWYHRYTLPGLRLDSAAIQVKLRCTQEGVEGAREVELKPDVDVRWQAAGELTAGTLEVASVVLAGDPRGERARMLGGSRRPLLVEVDEQDADWQRAAGAHDVLAGRRRSTRAVFLVRKGAFAAVGLEPGAELDPWRFELTWTTPSPQPVDIELKNVVGVLPGKQKASEYVLVSAHYDHIGIGAPVDGDAIRNGADDDASGTTAVVLLAEALQKGPPLARSVAFVCFSAEEKGLRGSQAFAERPPFPLEQVAVNVNIEMIGRPDPGKERQAWITGRDYSDFEAIAAAALLRAGIETVEFGMQTQLFTASDNASFVRKGIVAHSISAGALHRDYHRPSDSVDKLDIAHLTAVIRGLREVVVDFAGRPERPAWNERGREVVESLKRRR
jgi:hypothetical protein